MSSRSDKIEILYKCFFIIERTKKIMLSKSSDRELIHKYWIRANEKICLKNLRGWCDKLGQEPEEYPKTMRAIIAYEFLYPIVAIIVFFAIISQVTLSVLIAVFSVIFIPIIPLIIGTNLIIFLVLIFCGIIIEISYLYYLSKQIGVYTLIPIGAFVVQILLTLVPFIGVALATIFGLLPWSILAIGAHYVHYQVGIGIVFNADKTCYLNRQKNDNFSLDW